MLLLLLIFNVLKFSPLYSTQTPPPHTSHIQCYMSHYLSNTPLLPGLRLHMANTPFFYILTPQVLLIPNSSSSLLPLLSKKIHIEKVCGLDSW